MRTLVSTRKRRLQASIAVAVLSMAMATIDCSNLARGAAMGGLLGGSLGGLIGHRTGNTAAGILIGAAIGGAAGSAIGGYMDKQAAELRDDLKNAKVERVGEGIKITFDSGILFGIDSSTLTSQAQSNIQNLASTLKKYDETNIIVQGYTDSTGSQNYNQELSERRAASVTQEMIRLNVVRDRLHVEGYGEEKPVADNGTNYGRSQNRRVEIAIYANKKLKQAAMQNENLESL
jgi:outer membrane protein OmpA-like peptidoglycan-associated protein